MTSPLITRRTLIKSGGLAAVGAMTLGAGPCSGPSKEKAVRVAGFIIEITKEALPLLDLLNAPQLAQLVRDKALPALEKLKEALSNAEIPESRSTLATVRSILSSVETALLNLPESARVTTVIGILATVRVTLLTVEAFIESEMTTTTSITALSANATGGKMRKVLEVARQ